MIVIIVTHFRRIDLQNEIADIIRGIAAPDSDGKRLSDAFAHPDVHSCIKASLAAKFPSAEGPDGAKPWFRQIKTKFDRLTTGEPGFLRNVVATSLLLTKVLTDYLRASTAREPTLEDYLIFLSSNEEARKAVYEQVRFIFICRDQFIAKSLAIQFEIAYDTVRRRLQDAERSARYRERTIQSEDLVPSSSRVIAPPPNQIVRSIMACFKKSSTVILPLSGLRSTAGGAGCKEQGQNFSVRAHGITCDTISVFLIKMCPGFLIVFFGLVFGPVNVNFYLASVQSASRKSSLCRFL